MNDKTLIMHYNIDSKGNPTAVKIDEENKQVSSICYCVQLRQVPDEKHRMVVIDDKGNELTEVYNFEDIGENDYYINYISSVVYFHPSKAGKTYIFSYYGLGYELVGASRIYDEKSLDGKSIIKTLQDIIDKGRECIEALSTIGDAIELLRRIENYIIEATKLDIKLREDIRIGDILHLNLTNDISTGTTLHNNLTNDITVGTKLKTDLGNNIATGTTVNNNLKASITEGNTTKTKLDQSILEAQDDIATIQATGNGTWTIPSSAWTGTAPDLTYNLKHNMNSKNLVVSVVDTTTQKSVLPDYRIVDMNNIEIQSTKAMSITVTINAKYYSGKDANIIAQEVQDARGGEASLDVRLDKYGTQLAENTKQLIPNFYDGAMVTFIDDDCKESVSKWEAIASEKGIKLSFAVVKDWVGTSGYCTLDKIKLLQNNGHDILNHTKSHKNNWSITDSEIRTEIEESITYMKDNGLKGYDILVYPGTVPNEDKYKTITREKCRYGISNIYNSTSGVQDSFYMNRIDSDFKTLAELQTVIDEAITNKQWVLIMTHSWREDGNVSSRGTFSIEKIKQLIDYVKNKNIPILKFSEAEKYKGNSLSIGSYENGVYIAKDGKSSMHVGKIGDRLEVDSTNTRVMDNPITSYAEDKETIVTIKTTLDTFLGVGGTMRVFRSSQANFSYATYVPWNASVMYIRHWGENKVWGSDIPKWTPWVKMGT